MVAVDAVVDEAADEDGDDEATVVVEAELADEPCACMPWPPLSPCVLDGADPVNEDEAEVPVPLPPLMGGIRLLIPPLLLILLAVVEVHLKMA